MFLNNIVNKMLDCYWAHTGQSQSILLSVQFIQSAAAWLLFNLPEFPHPVRPPLDIWLPEAACITFKLLVVVHKDILWSSPGPAQGLCPVLCCDSGPPCACPAAIRPLLQQASTVLPPGRGGMTFPSHKERQGRCLYSPQIENSPNTSRCDVAFHKQTRRQIDDKVSYQIGSYCRNPSVNRDPVRCALPSL